MYTISGYAPDIPDIFIGASPFFFNLPHVFLYPFEDEFLEVCL